MAIFPHISRYSLRISLLECLIYTTCKTWLREIREGTVNGFVSVVWGNIPKNRYMSRVYSPTISYNYNFIATGSICHCFHLGMVRYGFRIPTDTNHQQPTTTRWAPACSKWNYSSADRGGKKKTVTQSPIVFPPFLELTSYNPSYPFIFIHLQGLQVITPFITRLRAPS